MRGIERVRQRMRERRGNRNRNLLHKDSDAEAGAQQPKDVKMLLEDKYQGDDEITNY